MNDFEFCILCNEKLYEEIMPNYYKTKFKKCVCGLLIEYNYDYKSFKEIVFKINNYKIKLLCNIKTIHINNNYDYLLDSNIGWRKLNLSISEVILKIKKYINLKSFQ